MVALCRSVDDNSDDDDDDDDDSDRFMCRQIGKS